MQKICAGVTRTGDLRFHASFPAIDTGMVLPEARASDRDASRSRHKGLSSESGTCGACGSRSVVSDSATPWTEEPTGLLCPWGSPGKNTAAGSHSLLQGIFSTQGSNTCLLDSFRFFTAEPSGLAHSTPHFQRRLGLNYSGCFQQGSEASMAIMKE